MRLDCIMTHVVEDALREYLASRQSGLAPRQRVLDAYVKSTERYAGLYKKLAEYPRVLPRHRGRFR